MSSSAFLGMTLNANGAIGISQSRAAPELCSAGGDTLPAADARPAEGGPAAPGT